MLLHLLRRKRRRLPNIDLKPGQPNLHLDMRRDCVWYCPNCAPFRIFAIILVILVITMLLTDKPSPEASPAAHRFYARMHGHPCHPNDR